MLLAYELNHLLSWGPDFALIETGYYRITKNLSLLHHTSLMKICVIWNHVSFLFVVNSWTAPTPRKGIYSCGWSKYSLGFGNIAKHSRNSSVSNLNSQCDQNITGNLENGHYPHMCCQFMLCLSLLECSPLILQHKTIKQKPYCQVMIFFNKLGNFEQFYFSSINLTIPSIFG